jgi:hypothetical protein
MNLMGETGISSKDHPTVTTNTRGKQDSGEAMVRGKGKYQLTHDCPGHALSAPGAGEWDVITTEWVTKVTATNDQSPDVGDRVTNATASG